MTSLPLPPPVSIAVLKKHFKTTYQLGDSQVELMLQSSRKSLDKILTEAEVALQAEDVCSHLVSIGHSLKGLLLNMGESEWAAFAREFERAAREDESRDYATVIAQLNVGMAAVIAYSEES